MRIQEIRRRNFLYLADKVHGRNQLADLMGYEDTNYLNGLARGHNNIGDSTAAKIEAAARKPEGWLDTPHPALWGESGEEVLKFTSEILDTLATPDLAKLVERTLAVIAARKE